MSIKVVTHYTDKTGDEIYLAYDSEAPGDIFRATGGAHGWVHAQNHEMWQVLNELASKKSCGCSGPYD